MALTLGKITVGGQLVLRLDDGTELPLGRIDREVDLVLNASGDAEVVGLPPLAFAVAPEPEERPLGLHDLVTVRDTDSSHHGVNGRIIDLRGYRQALVELDDKHGTRKQFHLDSLVRRLVTPRGLRIGARVLVKIPGGVTDGKEGEVRQYEPEEPQGRPWGVYVDDRDGLLYWYAPNELEVLE